MFFPSNPSSPKTTPKLTVLATSLFSCFIGSGAWTIVPALASTSNNLGVVETNQPEPAPPEAAPVPALQVPAATETAPAPATNAGLAVDSAEAFIDKTPDYSLGATQPAPSAYEPPSEIVIIPGTQSATTTGEPAIAAENPVQVGGVNLSSGGISWNDRAAEAPAEPAAPSYSTASASEAVSSSVSSVNPGLPYLNPKLIQNFARMGNENLRLLFPVAIPSPITSLFGWRIHPLTGSQRMHTGTDIGAPMGAPVLAALAGRVILADVMGGYGMAIAIEHDNGVRQTLYGHLSELFVKPGDQVQQGTMIGRVGSTGASTGPHLHFEFRQMMPDGTWVALDAGRHLEVAMGDLVKSLQIAQQSPRAIAQKP